MSVTFYCGSGSPYAWRVWLGLEHKAIPYELKLLSFSAGDTRAPEFLKLNPRNKVPVLVDDGYVLYESAAILEYLDDRFPDAPKLFPGNASTRGTIRRLIREIDEYVSIPSHRLTNQLFFNPRERWVQSEIRDDVQACQAELKYFESQLVDDYLAGPISAADFSLYPRLAILISLSRPLSRLQTEIQIPPKLTAWMRRIERLPYFDKTYPPSWRR
jgi:glutathione S-transferase